MKQGLTYEHSKYRTTLNVGPQQKMQIFNLFWNTIEKLLYFWNTTQFKE
jgi:hypothetical protein